MKQQELHAQCGVPSILGSSCHPDTLAKWPGLSHSTSLSLSFFMAGEREVVAILIVKNDTHRGEGPVLGGGSDVGEGWQGGLFFCPGAVPRLA